MISDQSRRTNIQIELARFKQHKKALLDILREVHAAAPRSEPFDQDATSRALVRAATMYFLRIKQKTMLPARRVDRLNDLAKALKRPRSLAQKAMQDEVCSDLFRGWCEEANISLASTAVPNIVGTSVLTSAMDQLQKAVAALDTLQKAAATAALSLRTKPGPRRGNGILAVGDTLALVGVYRASTGQIPIIGAGPFADFVGEFLVAVGQSKRTTEDYAVEHFKYLRKQVRKEARRVGTLSVFDR